MEDPYKLTADKIQEPPDTLWGRLRHLGPSFILSASIVGSGELIATTTLGAKAGFIAFWVIIVSCFIKVAVQLEMGRHTILHGETAMQAFSQLPGPRWSGTRWSIWLVFLIMIVKLLQLGGIVGGVAIILNMVWGGLSVAAAAFLVAILVALLIFKGYYKLIERTSIVLIALFTLFTFTSLYFLKFTDFALKSSDLLTGLSFQLPATAIAIALGAFGITGVGGDEIIHYNYWCLEKGYAAKTGRNDGSDQWAHRAKGWLQVMRLDAIIAMLIYTVVTSAFYLLGAAVLHAQQQVPESYAMIEALSNMYTATLGAGAKPFFLLGSFMVLFSTLFAALAAWTRQYADMFGQLGWIEFSNLGQRTKVIAFMAWILPITWALLFVYIKLPVIMVISGGIVGSVLLLLVVFATLHFRYRRAIEAFKPNLFYDLWLWVSAISITLIAVMGFAKLL